MIKIVEVGPRDGLQNEKMIISTQDKVEFIRLLSLSGLSTIEVTSFVKAPAVAQMADAANLFESVRDLNLNVHLPCLVPNLKGYELAHSLGVKEIAVFTATSDSFTRKNINATIDESFHHIEQVTHRAQIDQIKVRGYISTAFGCPYEGKIKSSKVLEVARRLFELGVYEISIGDTIGVATPAQVKSLINELKEEFPLQSIAMHFHDTRGMALTNIYASLEQGITIFDASAGGLGGCPYAQGATGNVATEDLWYLMNSLGLSTGIHLDKLVTASQFILQKLGKRTDSKFLQTYLTTGHL
jgi:hydroxymethylglutaryl-CoA lyase